MSRLNSLAARCGVAAMTSVLMTACAVFLAGAQIAPDDSGAGTQLGLQQINNSGQTGTVTLFRRGDDTLVGIQLVSEPVGRLEPVHLQRGKSCDDIDSRPAFGLAPVANGSSRTLVRYPEDKLLSGNYDVVVHASDNQLAHYVSCGHLYR